MSGVLLDLGIKQRLLECKTNWNTTALKLHLFKNNVTPTTSSTISSFTEADFAGYAAVSMTGWTTATVTAHIASMTADAKTFTRTSTGTAQTIYGYYITDNASSIALYAERDALAPITLTNNGDSYTVTPNMSDKDVST